MISRRLHLLWLVLGLCSWQSQARSEALTRVEVARQSGPPPLRVSGPVALEMQANELANVITNQIRAVSQPAEEKRADSQDLMLGVVLVIGGLFILGTITLKVAEFANRLRDPWAIRAGVAQAQAVDEEKAFDEFATAFARGPTGAAAGAPAFDLPAESEAAPPAPAPLLHNDREKFLQDSAKRLENARKLFSDLGRNATAVAQQPILAELRQEIANLRRDADLPSAKGIWQMTSALDGLLQQMVQRPQNINPSTLRTLASAIDLLHGLRLHGLERDLVTTPPVRLLVVDDDAISRHAMAFALKKVFTMPDLANEGEAALKLAEANAYDVILLDIQMPRMDGFELCSRIHGTLRNATTPVVFVTCRSDFEARTKSMLIGAQDLLAKPFLTFELTVKALTSVLRRRLESHAGNIDAANPELVKKLPLLEAPTDAPSGSDTRKHRRKQADYAQEPA